MRRQVGIGMCLAGCLLFWGSMASRAGQTGPLPEALRIGRYATATVYAVHRDYKLDGYELGEATGTAFCITQSGYFLTDAHVVKGAHLVRIGLEIKPRTVHYYDAHVFKLDETLDLALLKVDKAPGLKPIPIATPATITAGMHVTAFGFPVKESLPNVFESGEPFFWNASIHPGKVTALLKKGQALTDIETDTGMSPGASGGPVLNDQGQLVGILQMQRSGTKLNLSKSARAILQYLATPEIAPALHNPDLQFSLPGGIPVGEATQEHSFVAELIPGLDPLQGMQVTLTFNAPGAPARTCQSFPRPDGSSELRISPLPLPAAVRTVTLTTSDGDPAHTLSGSVQDRPLRIGGRSIELSAIARIDQGTEPVTILRSGERLTDPVQGLESLQMAENSRPFSRNPGKEKRIIVRDDDEQPREIFYRFAVTRAAKTLVEHTGGIHIDGLPPHLMGQPILIACGSAWATNNTGSGQGHASDLSPSTVQYIRNILDILTGGAKSNILILSEHWTFGAPFQEVVRAAGHNVAVTLDPGPLDRYDVVFLGDYAADQGSVIDYVKRGGKVYLSTGQDARPGNWGALLPAFGIDDHVDVLFEKSPVSGLVYTPLFEGVKELTLKSPMHLQRNPQAPRDAQIIVNQSEKNIWAIYRGGEKLGPEPAARVVRPFPTRRPPAAVEKRKEYFNAIDWISSWRDKDETERDHHLQGDRSRAKEAMGMNGRIADDGAWFSYELKVDPNIECALQFVYYTDDTDMRGMDIWIDGVKLPEPKYQTMRTNAFYRGMYVLAHNLLVGKDHVVVKFQARPGKSTGCISGCAIVNYSISRPSPENMLH